MKEVPPDPPQELLGKRIFGVAFVHSESLSIPHVERTKTPLDPLSAVDLTNLGGEKLPMSIEAVVHAEDADCRGYDSVGTL